MSLPPAISVKNVSKAYRIWDTPAARLTAPVMDFAGRRLGAGGKWLQERAARSFRDFWALKDVTFEVGKGEAVGIIGRNGSGKSTLLQLIVGTLQPTSGTVQVQGRVAALLELGSGFNPDFTGRENVYLNATVLGLSRAEIDARFESIAAFADIGDFMEQPVKTYSSGMMVRLAFAVQTAIEPDILIIDEALGVGDFFFQQKCAARMRELRERGTTLLFVSHDMASVRDLCERALYLRKGEAVFFGESQEAVGQYYAEADSHAPARPMVPPVRAAGLTDRRISRSDFLSRALWTADSSPDIPETGRLLGLAVLDPNGQPATRAVLGSRVRVQILFQAGAAGVYHAAIELKNRYDHVVTSVSSYTCGLPGQSLGEKQLCILELELQLNFEAGRYTLQTVLGDHNPQANRGRRLDSSPWLGPIEITWDYENDRAPFLGMFGPPVEARFIN